MNHISENSYPFAVSIFEIKPFNNLPPQGTKRKDRVLGVEKWSMWGSEAKGESSSEEQSSGDDFASHCVNKRIIHSVDVNYHLADNPLISSSVSFYTQAEISQKCLMAIRYLLFITCSSFPRGLVAFGLIAQADCSQINAWVGGGQGAGVMEASSMETGELAEIVLLCILAHRAEPGLGGVPFFNTAFLQVGHLSLPFSPVLVSRRELQDGML